MSLIEDFKHMKWLPLAGGALLCALGLLLYRKRWAAPEYSFFWGKAMSW